MAWKKKSYFPHSLLDARQLIMVYKWAIIFLELLWSIGVNGKLNMKLLNEGK